MAIRPEIILSGRPPPDIGAAFNNALLNVQRGQQIGQQAEQAPAQNRLLEAQATTAEGQATSKAEQSRLRSVVQGAAELIPDIESGDIHRVSDRLQTRRARLQEQGLPTNDTDEALAILQQPDGLQQLGEIAKNSVQLGKQLGLFKTPTAASTRSSAPITDPTTGQVSIPTFNPATNKVDLLPVEGAIQLTPRQKVDLEIEQAQGKATATNRAARISAVTGEINDRNRAAKRGEINLSQAATLVEQAQQGATGASKVKLARLFPGIDVSNEAALSQSLTNLALDELQKFSGPTTDFEFGKTEEIAGTLGDSQPANRAKIASLRRANWFNQREAKQFQSHVKNGGDPDSFGFNFGEPIKTKKGVFTLRDLQDTAVALNISIDEALKRLNK